jgi:hypothetical protein
MKRIVIIGNKTWEVEPVTYAMTSPFFAKVQLAPSHVFLPHQHRNGELRPTMVWQLSDDLVIELWCLQKIMTVDAAPFEYERHYSSSEQKFRHLPAIMQYHPRWPDLVIALASGSYPSEISYNGSVVVGSGCYINNARSDGSNPVSAWTHARMQEVIPSNVSPDFFDRMNLELATPASRQFFARRLIKTPMHPGETAGILAHRDLLALSNVNMVDSEEYAIHFRSGLKKLETAAVLPTLGVVETTIGIIRLCVQEAPFLFISPITDRAGYYHVDVESRDIAQNFTACLNGGIVMSWLIPFLAKYYIHAR